MKKIISFLKLAWVSLDEKKTIIAACILVSVPYVNDFFVGFLNGLWHVPVPGFLPQILSSMTYIGNGLAKVGLLHKLTKAKIASMQGDLPPLDKK